MSSWQSLLGVTPAAAERWNRLDLREAVAAMCDWHVHAMKDTAAACVAELVEGRGRGMHSFLYIFVDTFIGGGLVIDSHLRNGLTGNAGAIGSMPLGLPDGHGAAPQLLSVASLHTLEQAWRDAALSDPGFEGPEALQAPWQDVTRAWLGRAATAIAHAINGATCLLDLDGVIIDGAIHRSLRDELIAATEAAMRRSNWEGVIAPQLFAGIHRLRRGRTRRRPAAAARQFRARPRPLHQGARLMSHSLSGQVAVVTGAASGIGLASARALVDAGARVVLVDRDAAALAAACAPHGDAMLPLVIDLLDAGPAPRWFPRRSRRPAASTSCTPTRACTSAATSSTRRPTRSTACSTSTSTS